MAARPAPPPTDDAFHAIATIGPWVNNADTKIGLLTAAVTVLGGALLRQRHNVDVLLHPHQHQHLHAGGWVALALLTVSALAVVVAGFWLFWGLRPRLTNPSPSRFAFPYLATADLDSLVHTDTATIRAEAWVQAQSLSQIVSKKYRCFHMALIAGTVAGMAFIGWLLLTPALHP